MGKVENTLFNPHLDYRKLVSRGDLHYEHTVRRSEGGLPIGNGRMGSLVWTSPSAIKLQINRVDVYANDSSSQSFNQRHADYAYGCGFVDIDFVDYGQDVFHDEGIRQHLSLYDALASIVGDGVNAQLFASAHDDVFAIRAEDHREAPQVINIKLKMLRPSEVVTKHHSAISSLSIHHDKIVLKQEFSEGSYYCSSALVVGISGRDAAARMNDEFGGREPVGAFRASKVIGQPNETEIRLCVKPERGRFELFIGTAASFDRHTDVVAEAVNQVERARTAGFDKMLAEHTAWWNKYWSQSYIQLRSPDGTAEFVEMHYTYYLYLMASNSREGRYPPNFGGMLLSPRGDLRHWGAMHWWNNLNLYYNAVLPSGHYELFQPYFTMYTAMFDSCARAAEQQWGSTGIFIPEVVSFSGLEELPEDIAAEMRDLYLLRKPWDQMSIRFKEYAHVKPPHESRWNWKMAERFVDGKLVYPDRGYGPFGFTTHMFASQVGIAYHYWQYYEYTLDQTWLHDRAYPLIKGTAEFFRNFPNLKKEADGKYHIYHTISDEKYIDGKDNMDSMAAMHGIMPVLLRASEILGVDEEMWPIWREFYDNLAPLPTSDHPDAVLRTADNERAVWVGSLGPVLDQRSGTDLRPGRFCSLCTLETADDNPDRFETTMATIKYDEVNKYGGDWSRAASEMSAAARVLAGMGLAEEFKQAVLGQLECVNADKEYCYFTDTGKVKFFENRLTVREGVNCISAQRLGNAAAALQSALCQSQPAGPGKDSVIRIFPACPTGWEGEFSLWCHGGFQVTSQLRDGVIHFVQINSTLGGLCRIRNPWGDALVSLHKFAHKIRTINGTLLEFETEPGDQLELLSE